MLLAIALSAGCGGGASESAVSFGEGSVATGLEAFRAEDWAKAEEDLSAALAKGALQPDLAESALRSLAVSRIRLGKLDEAENDLRQLMEGAAEMDLCWLAKAELALKKGDPAATRAAVEEARKSNPAIEIPASLNQ
jgi:predicted Zn-dependent protease